MTDLGEIRAAAELAANHSLEPGTVREVRIEPALGSEGQDVLRVTVVVNDDRFDAIKDDDFLTTLVSIKNHVRDTGEDRQAIVSYVTPAELDSDAGTES